jgi:hypothetical protein
VDPAAGRRLLTRWLVEAPRSTPCRVQNPFSLSTLSRPLTAIDSSAHSWSGRPIATRGLAAAGGAVETLEAFIARLVLSYLLERLLIKLGGRTNRHVEDHEHEGNEHGCRWRAYPWTRLVLLVVLDGPLEPTKKVCESAGACHFAQLHRPSTARIGMR